jgi:hypothetical protein
MSIEAIGDYIRANPQPFAALNPQLQAGIVAFFQPDAEQGFNAAQSAFLRRWWLVCQPDTEAAINALPHPSKVKAVTDAAGRTLLSADLLSDALNGRRLADALPMLQGLTLVCDPTFPAPEPEALP